MSKFYIFPLFIPFFFIITGCNAKIEQKETTIDIYKSYSDKGGTFFSLPPRIVSVFLDEENPGDKELKALLSDIKRLSFLVIPNNGIVKESNYYSEIDQRLTSINFYDLAMINSGKEIVKVKISQDSNDQVDEMVVLVSNNETIFCITFQGLISQNKIVNLTKPQNMSAISNLNKINLR